MKKNDCLFSDIQNLSNAASDWLIKTINNPIRTKLDNILCLLSHVCAITAEPVNVHWFSNVSIYRQSHCRIQVALSALLFTTM